MFTYSGAYSRHSDLQLHLQSLDVCVVFTLKAALVGCGLSTQKLVQQLSHAYYGCNVRVPDAVLQKRSAHSGSDSLLVGVRPPWQQLLDARWPLSTRLAEKLSVDQGLFYFLLPTKAFQRNCMPLCIQHMLLLNTTADVRK